MVQSRFCGLIMALVVCGVSQAQRYDTLGKVEVLPSVPGSHWVWIGSRLVDIKEDKYLAVINGNGAFKYSNDHKYIYLPQTFWSRSNRGERTDAVTVFDSSTMLAIDDIVIPPKTGTVMSAVGTTTLTDDGRFLAIFNLTPATSISIVDTSNNTFVEEIATPGCSLVYGAGERSLLELCAGGDTVTIKLDDDGREISKSRSKVIFDPDVDPVTEKAVRYGNDWLFVSFKGTVYPIDASGRTTRIKRSWSMVSRDEKAEGWQIAGDQHLSVHQDSGMLYSLMRKGPGENPQDAGAEDGEEIWVFDLNTKKRVQRFAVHDFRPPDEEAAFKALHIDEDHWLANVVSLWLNSEEGLAATETSREQTGQPQSSPVSGPGGGSSNTPGAKSLLVTQGDDPLLLVVANGGTYTANAMTGEFIGKLKSAPQRGNLIAP
jgi:methylamine dehydrogenase heavy chain